MSLGLALDWSLAIGRPGFTGADAGKRFLLVSPGGGFLLNSTGGKIQVSITPPNFTSPNSDTFYTGYPGSFTPSANGNGYPQPLITLTGTLPAGITFNAGVLSGTASPGTTGIYNDVFSATTSATTTTQPFTLTVANPTVLLDATFSLAANTNMNGHQPSPVSQGTAWDGTVTGTTWKADGLGNVSVSASSGSTDILYTDFGNSHITVSDTFKIGTHSVLPGFVFNADQFNQGFAFSIDKAGTFNSGTPAYLVWDIQNVAQISIGVPAQVILPGGGVPAITVGAIYVLKIVVSPDGSSVDLYVGINAGALVKIGTYTAPTPIDNFNTLGGLLEFDTLATTGTQHKRITVTTP